MKQDKEHGLRPMRANDETGGQRTDGLRASHAVRSATGRASNGRGEEFSGASVEHPVEHFMEQFSSYSKASVETESTTTVIGGYEAGSST